MLTDKDQWKQIEKNLAEQESFVQSIIEHRERKSRPENNANIDNILSTSIQKAKQKISSIDAKSQPPRGDRSSENLATSREKKERGEQGSAIAAAMRKLQERISSLEQENKRLEGENKQLRKANISQTQKSDGLTRAAQQNKRKIKNLEQSIQKDKAYIRELQRKSESLEKQMMSQYASNKSEELETKLSTSEMMLRAQQQQFKNLINDIQGKQRRIMQLQNRRKEEEIRYGQEISIVKSLSRELQLKATSLEEKSRHKDAIIQNLRQQIKALQSQKMKASTQIHHRHSNLDEPTEHYSEHKPSKRRAQEPFVMDNSAYQQLKEKYEQLFLGYKSLEAKNLHQKQEAKNYRTKFWQLKEAVKELIEKINTLPSGVISQLKFLIVRVNKIQAYSVEYFAATPSKSARKSSFLNNTSRSKSNSKRKQIKIDLNRSNNSVKSKKSTHTNRSTDSKQSKSKQKQVIISQKSIKKNELAELQSQIQQIKRRYKEVAISRASDDVSEEMREELNSLAVLLQEKTEQLTKLKRKK